MIDWMVLFSVIVVLIILFIISILLIIKFNKKPSNNNQLNDLSRRLDDMNKLMNENLVRGNDSVHKQFAASQKLVADITEKMKDFENTNKNVLKATDKLEDLQNILLNPKHRGNFGEFQLESMLENVFSPKDWQRQYKYKNGEIVDAVLFIKDKILPIDSKFSLENYNKMINEKDPNRKKELTKIIKNDLKGRIDETSKYVKPSENTMDFAFMFIPSEALYYDMLIGSVGIGINQKDLIEYAMKERKVVIVSPTTFVAYLNTVMQGLRGLEIETQAKEIQKNVEKLGSHLNRYQEYMNKLGSSLKTTVNHYNTAGYEFKKVDKDIVKISGGDEKLDVMMIDKPSEE